MWLVPDRRIDRLSKLYKPRKTIYAQIEFFDVVGLVRGASQGQGVGNQFLNAIRDADAIIHVLRVFRNDDVVHVDGSIDPVRDLATVNYELLLSDLDTVEKRIEKIHGGKRRPEHEVELSALAKCKDALEAERPLHSVELTDEEAQALKGFTFFTEKPTILVVNADEEQFKSKEYPGQAALKEWAAEHRVPLIEICGQMEAEIAQLSDEDKELFMSDLGIEETGIERIARAAFTHLGLISFFTVGEDEVRAWPIRKGLVAKEAAGKIHSDIERGFIRAEVVAYEDLDRIGSMPKVKEAGLFRLEGKEYVVKDGDIINYRFAV
jgi:GTP-binding protein YchF